VKLPDIELDDRTFQELVSEARLRVGQACPEWTEHNVSDPGITLIELFAWMTEMVVYRLNRIPDKVHVTLLGLVGLQMEPPSAAEVDLRFRLAAPPEAPVTLPARVEVGTPRTPSEPPVVFQTREDVEIPVIEPVAYAVQRAGVVKDVGVAHGGARPKGSDQAAFGTPPMIGDALYLGFDRPLADLVVRIDVDCSPARGAGVDPEDPPLFWEVSTGTGEGWEPAEVLVDSTGGFNYGAGVVELQVGPRHTALEIGGRRAHWVRCRLDRITRAGLDAAPYAHPPEIYALTAAAMGALVPAEHAAQAVEEMLGESDGTPGQEFALRNHPILPTEEGEELDVLDPESGRWTTWQRVESFVESGPGDRHYMLDAATGTVALGPAIRTADGGWRQYGAIPPKGAQLRFSAYRFGGGRVGNVAPGALTQLKEAIPGVAAVTNPEAALGGVDAESLESVRRRAALEMRTRYRAVTAEDFEYLAGAASPRVARAICPEPTTPGVVRLHLVPQVEPAERRLTLDELTPDTDLLQAVGAYLDERRLIGTSIELVPARYRGVSVVVSLQASPRSDLDRVQEEVARALYTYLNPLVGGSLEGRGTGWEFGRALNQGELFGVVHAVEGVEFVKILRVYETDLATGEQNPQPVGSHVALEPDELIASGTHIVRAERREI
jgi:predicted phage baseplate assembly protein